MISRESAVHRRLAAAVALIALWAIASPAPQARADAPPCRYTIAADTVTDKDTSLTWQREPSAMKMSLTDAKSYCTALNVAGGGFRLPTIKELQTLLDEKRRQPAIDPTAFPKTPADETWTSTAAGGSAWVVNFNLGECSAKTSAADTAFVRCVR